MTVKKLAYICLLKLVKSFDKSSIHSYQECVQNKHEMLKKISEQLKIDPSGVYQNFRDVQIKLFSCRYWVLEEWEFDDLSVPYWRIYHSCLPGAKIIFKNQTIAIQEDSIIIIPPNTSFSSQLKKDYDKPEESIKGRRFVEEDDLKTLKRQELVDQLFIHFSLGYPLDFLNNEVYVIKCNWTTKDLLNQIKQSCIEDTAFSFQECLRIKNLIIESLLHLPDQIWHSENIDLRIFKSIKFIEANYKNKITNEALADDASMATNSFARLFKSVLGISLQQYIIKVRIEAACNLIHHTDKSLDDVAFDCGFSDRHHFSKIFKKQMKVNPSDYKKRLKM